MVSSLIDTLSPTKAEADSDLDFCFLDLALALAAKGEGQVRPNPLVGTVIVKDGVVVGQGFHRYDRVWHAEVLALEEAGRLSERSNGLCQSGTMLPPREWQTDPSVHGRLD